MHRTACARYTCAELAPNALVSETDAENWHLTGKFANDGCRYSSLIWSARAGEMTIARGLRSASSLTCIASFRTTHVAAPSLRKYRAMLKTKES